MIGIAGLRPAGDQLRLLGAGLGIVTCFLLAIFLPVKYNIDLSKYVPSRGALTFYIWATGLCAAVAYLLLQFIIGKKRVDDLTSKVLEKLVRIYQRARLGA